ncbi:flagellar hook-length control protein FliK [Sulfitobacter guttiformis]|uniref:Flagellar hook-length control protein FliK n=2 Tax=Sulfitobacter guttiformis TaxID=74349 RepID=A0A420DSI6_9RHOB|nr:flagellar hook-length control protein FliK [Sulfitobacter guttiformis]
MTTSTASTGINPRSSPKVPTASGITGTGGLETNAVRPPRHLDFASMVATLPVLQKSAPDTKQVDEGPDDKKEKRETGMAPTSAEQQPSTKLHIMSPEAEDTMAGDIEDVPEQRVSKHGKKGIASEKDQPQVAVEKYWKEQVADISRTFLTQNISESMMGTRRPNLDHAGQSQSSLPNSNKLEGEGPLYKVGTAPDQSAQFTSGLPSIQPVVEIVTSGNRGTTENLHSPALPLQIDSKALQSHDGQSAHQRHSEPVFDMTQAMPLARSVAGSKIQYPSEPEAIHKASETNATHINPKGVGSAAQRIQDIGTVAPSHHKGTSPLWNDIRLREKQLSADLYKTGVTPEMRRFDPAVMSSTSPTLDSQSHSVDPQYDARHTPAGPSPASPSTKQGIGSLLPGTLSPTDVAQSLLTPTDAPDIINWDQARSATHPTGTFVPLRSDLHLHVARQIAVVADQAVHRPVEIALSPDELGRVRMSVKSEDGAITVSILAERPDTLDLMRRNIDQLGQTFRSMGYDSISFSFGQGGERANTSQDNANSNPDGSADAAGTSHQSTPSDHTLIQLDRMPASGVDIRL